MSRRAERLGAYLERRDWTIFEANDKCDKCGRITGFADSARFCQHCAAPLKRDQHRAHVLKGLEGAIKYALRKDGKDA